MPESEEEERLYLKSGPTRAAGEAEAKVSAPQEEDREGRRFSFSVSVCLSLSLARAFLRSWARRVFPETFAETNELVLT